MTAEFADIERRMELLQASFMHANLSTFADLRMGMYASPPEARSGALVGSVYLFRDGP